MNRLHVITLALLAGSAHAATLADYAYTFPIQPPADTNAGAWRIDLTPAAYAYTQDAALRDIEVFNAEGRAVPLARVAAPADTSAREHTESVPLLPLPDNAPRDAGDLHLLIERDASGRLHRLDLDEPHAASKPAASKPASARDWIIDASAIDAAIERIVLTWDSPDAGVVAHFEISASDDLAAWHHAGNGSVMALRQDNARLDRRDIPLAEVRAKYLRLHRLDDGAELLGLHADARVIEHSITLPQRSWVIATHVPTTAEHSEAPVVARYEYALPAALPVELARVELADDNALAALTLSARDDTHWTQLARFTAFRLRSGGETLRNSDIDLASGSRERVFRLDAATPLANAPRLAFAFRADRFVFLAEGSAPYVLAVGSVRARRPEYPLEVALTQMRAQLGKDWQPPLAALGDARASSSPTALVTPTPWRKWALWAVLVLGAAVVGGFALSLLRGDRGHQ